MTQHLTQHRVFFKATQPSRLAFPLSCVTTVYHEAIFFTLNFTKTLPNGFTLSLPGLFWGSWCCGEERKDANKGPTPIAGMYN